VGGKYEVTTNTRGWRPVKAGVERVVPVDDASGPTPLFELRIELEEGPTDGEWADLFRASPVVKAGDRSMMESDPVLVGSVVTWKVSQPSLPHAEKFIRRRIEWANETFAATLDSDPADDLDPADDRDRDDPQPSPPSPDLASGDQRETEAIQWFLERHRQRV
jgi:hypothetical protein